MLRLATKPGSHAFTVKVSANEPRTLSERRGRLPLSRNEPASSSYLALSWFASRLPSTSRARCLCTDFCNRPTTRAPEKPHDSRARGSRRSDRLRPALRGVMPWMQRSTASDHLAAIRPQVNRRLTSPIQLRSARSRSSARGGRERAAFAALPRSGVIDRDPRRNEPSSDAPCRPSRTRSPGASKDQDRFPRPFVKRGGFPGPKRLPSTSATAETMTRHRAHSLAAGEPASGALSPPPMLSH